MKEIVSKVNYIWTTMSTTHFAQLFLEISEDKYNINVLTIMLGKVAYLGSLRRKSALITAGSLHFMFSKPPSISLFTKM